MKIGVCVPDVAEYGQWWQAYPNAKFARVDFPQTNNTRHGLPRWDSTAISRLPQLPRLLVTFADQVTPAQLSGFFDGLPDEVELHIAMRHPLEKTDGDADAIRAYTQTMATVRDNHQHGARIHIANLHTLWACRWRPQVHWRHWMMPGIADYEGWEICMPQHVGNYEPPESLLGLPIAAAHEFATQWAITALAVPQGWWDPKGEARAAWVPEAVDVALWGACQSICVVTGEVDMTDYRTVDKPTREAWQKEMAGLSS